MSDNRFEYDEYRSFSKPLRRWRTVCDYLLPSFGKTAKLSAELDLMAMCLGSSPDAYLFWQDDNKIVSSRKARNILGIVSCDKKEDFCEAFSDGDKASLLLLLRELQEKNTPFTLTAETKTGRRILNIEGVSKNHGETVNLYILWLRDITRNIKESDRAEILKEKAENEAARYKAGIEKLSFPVWFRDAELRITACNTAYAKALDITPDEAVEGNSELLGAKSALAKNLAERAKISRSSVSERYHVIIGGERRLFQLNEIYLHTSDTLVGYAIDITSHEETETELKRFKASSSELLRALNTGIAIFEPDKRLSFYNDAFMHLWKLDEAWLNGKPSLGEIYDALREKRRLPEQADFRKFKESWNAMFTSLISPHEEMMHLPDGTAVRTLVVPHPMGGLFITYEDVTSRLQLESSYNTLIAVQRETIDNLAEGLAVIGSGGRVELFNPTYARIWGLKKRDLADTPHITKIVDRCKKFFNDAEWEDIRQELLDSALVREEKKGRLYLNDFRVLEYVTAALPDGGILIRFSDVTDSLRVENALLEKNAALEAAERLKLDFLANVSYQLRTPLNAMMGFAEVLDMEYFGPMNERQKEYSRGMLDAGRKLITLINDILDLSTIEAGYFELNIGKTDIYAVLKPLFDISRDWAAGQGIQMTMECPKDIGFIDSDERRLKQVLLHIISNAIKFTPEKGKIALGAEKLGRDKVALWVKDTGEGISDDDKERVFGAFVVTKQHNKGAGLGLSLVKSIIELMGGEVILDSEIGKGTKITCVLPVKGGK